MAWLEDWLTEPGGTEVYLVAIRTLAIDPIGQFRDIECVKSSRTPTPQIKLMITTFQHAKPKTLTAGEGDTHPLLTHTIVWKATATDTNGHYALFEMSDQFGGGAPVHSHPWEETFYILEGEIEILLGNRREVFGAGAMVHIPANAVHAFQICSPSARALGIVAPGNAEAFYREAGAKLTALPPDPIVMQELAEKYQLRLC